MMEVAGTLPRGAHNIGNLAAAASAALALGLIEDPLSIDLGSYGDLPHRLQVFELAGGVTAVDDSGTRMKRVHENLMRTGLDAELLTADAREVTGRYDAILLDAPCSATGTIRRHPDLPHAKDGTEFGDLIEQQEILIDHAWSLLPPGGRLVFCTCSLLPDEGEVQVEEALARHADMTCDTPLPEGIDASWKTEEGGLRLRPDYWADAGGMDGFYMACLRKAA